MKSAALTTKYAELLALEIDKLKTLPALALDKFAASGKTQIHTGNYPEGMEPPMLQGGWKTVIRKNKNGPSSMYLKASDKRTGDILAAGQVKFAMDAGLSEANAKVWAKAPVAFKHDVINELSVIMKDSDMIKAYLEVPTSKNADKKATKEEWFEWMQQHNITDHIKFNLRGVLGELVHLLTLPPDQQEEALKRPAKTEPTGLSAELMALLVDVELPPADEVPDEALDASRNGNTGGVQVAEQPAVGMAPVVN